MRFTAIIALLSFLLLGCSTHQYLRSPLDANRGSITDHAEILLHSGSRIDAVDIIVGNDFTQYVLIGTDSLRKIRTNDIDKLIVTNHIYGAIDGFLAGSVGGPFIGGVLVPDKHSDEMAPLIYVASGLAIGSIGGAIYGWFHGPQDNYIFPSDSIKDLTQKCVTDTTDRRLVKTILEEIFKYTPRNWEIESATQHNEILILDSLIDRSWLPTFTDGQYRMVSTSDVDQLVRSKGRILLFRFGVIQTVDNKKRITLEKIICQLRKRNNEVLYRVLQETEYKYRYEGKEWIGGAAMIQNNGLIDEGD